MLRSLNSSHKDGATFLDYEIYNIETSIPASIERAKANIAMATHRENVLAVSYGTTIVAANVAYTATQVWNKNLTDFEYADWGTVLANAGYAWGYGGLWLLDGQLESPVPSCGVEDFYSALDSSPVPSLQAPG